MIWIWKTVVYARGMPVADFDHEHSIISSSDITVISERVSQRSPADIVVLVPRVIPSKLDKMHTLPNTINCPLVDETLAEIIKRHVGSDVQLMPVTVRARGGNILRFSFARPLVHLPCLDVERSDIDSWIIPGVRIMDARLLVFKPNCLGDRYFVRDTLTGEMLVSERLEDALLATGDGGLKFVLPEDVWNIFWDEERRLH